MATFWKILGVTAAAVIVMIVLDKFLHDKPDPMFMSVMAIIAAMATGFECVVDAIQARD